MRTTKAIAAEVARALANDSINRVSDVVAEIVIGEEPIVTRLVAGALASLILQNLAWDYSEPERDSEDRYSVIATATANVKIEMPPLVDKSYVVSLPFNLDVDADAKSVFASLAPTGIDPIVVAAGPCCFYSGLSSSPSSWARWKSFSAPSSSPSNWRARPRA